MLTYLCLTIASEKKDSMSFFKHEIKWDKNSTPHTMYNILLQPTINSPNNGVWIWENSEKIHMMRPVSRDWNLMLRECLDYIVNLCDRFDGFIYSGHGGTINVGSWFRDYTPFFKICDLISIFENYHLSFPVMIFSSCYMGGFITLLECSRITKWVCADPGYTGYDGITATTSFWGRRKRGKIGKWLSEVISDYHKRYPTPKYKCYMAFDVGYIQPLFGEMKKTNPMEWGWEGHRVSNYDKTTYDLYSVLIDDNTQKTKPVTKMISYCKKMMRYSKNSPYTINKKGPSIQWGRVRHVQDRYEGTMWWDFWKTINLKTVSFV
uniref:Peptidase C13 family protein n=1 Tax=viral metagenome TaxID=1070528 RepID=A0A6C0KI80_9ZZZZ